MAKKQLRWGIVGCANIAIGSVIPAIQQSETGVVAAIASRSLDKAQETAAKLNIPTAYGSYEELIADPDIDAVYIPLPNHLHREWTIRAAQAGKHVLCEKPLAMNAEEAEEMIEACKQAGVLLAEAFMYRHHPRYERMIEVIRSGEIGQIRGILGSFTFNNAGDKDNVRYRADWGGGSIYDVGCYPISAARLLFGAEPVSACVTAFFSPEHDHVDMMAQGVIEFPGDVALTFDCGMWADFRNKLEILGTEGRIEVPWAFLNPSDGEGFYVVKRGERREEGHLQTNQYTLQVDDFARSVFGEQPLRFAPEDAVSNMKVIDACLKSARTKTKVEI